MLAISPDGRQKIPVDQCWSRSRPPGGPRPDLRRLAEGGAIPSQLYTDQPYVIRLADGAWLCVLTTGHGLEGERGQHVVSLRSQDQGRTWSEPVALEPPTGPEASWAVPLATPSGRIFVFYVYNSQNLRQLPCGDGVTDRMDSHGDFVFRWSEDGGRSWSADRGVIPVREFTIDRQNTTHGKVRLFWNVGRPLISRGEVFVPLHKVAGFGTGWFTRSEGAFVASSDLLAAKNPLQATWETLPLGEEGLKTPAGGGEIAEEQNLVELQDGSFFCVYRSVDGHPVGAYSRDRARTWEPPAYLTFRQGRRLKHPRAACFVWRLAHGGYLLWFHHHGGAPLRENPECRVRAYDDRNPAWMARGEEVPGPRGHQLVWDEPEIVLYDDDPCVRTSYPDVWEDGGEIFISETQKQVARIHRVPALLCQALRDGPRAFPPARIREDRVAVLTGPEGWLPPLPGFLAASPALPHGGESQRTGFTLEWRHTAQVPPPPEPFFEAWSPTFGGVRARPEGTDAFRISFSDGRTEASWLSDPVVWGPGRHIIVVVDGGPRLILMYVDGILQDGGDRRQFGWGRFSPAFRGLPAGLPLHLNTRSLASLGFYRRALLSAEVAALARAD